MKMKLFKSIIIVFFISNASIVLGQGGNSYVSEINNIIPPSPNASALGKYAETPVSLYTGVPNINIPLYEIKGRRINVSVSLSYHASGVKVSETPTWIGQGWTLNAGGVITSAVHNQPDWKTFGLNNTRPLIPETLDYLTVFESGSFLYMVENNEIDVEPDIFYYNFNGYTGSFTTDNDGNPVLMPHEELRIVPDWSGKKWTITTEDGTIYIFDECEEINYESTCDNITPSQDYVPNSWYLTSITSADESESILFEYEDTNGNYQTNTSEHIKESWHENEDEIYYNNSEIQRCYNVTNIFGKLIKKIITSNCIVEFFGSGQLPYNQLDSIYIYRNTGGGYYEPFKMYEFSYSYFNHFDCENTPDFLCKRLRLDKVTERSLIDRSLTKPPYTLEYNDTPLPPRNSYAQDEWGYYNGANDNNSFIPTVKYYNGLNPIFQFPQSGQTNFNYVFSNPFAYFSPGLFAVQDLWPYWITPDGYRNEYKGNNRDTDTSYLFAGILEKINLPTGGYTAFEYEPNDFGYLPGGQGYDQGEIGYRKLFYENYDDITCSASCPEGADTVSNTFYIEYKQVVKISYMFRGLNPNLIPGNYNYSKVKIKRYDHPGFQWEIEFSECNPGQGNNNPCTRSGFFYELLDTGTYKLTAMQRTYGSGYDFPVMISVKFGKNYIVKNTKIGGGVRIKSIIDHDGISHDNDIIREYKYTIMEENDTAYRSSGVLVKRNRFLRVFNPESLFGMTTLQIILSGNNFGGLGSGNPIGYRRVEVSQTGNGKNVNYFSTPMEYPDFGLTFFPYPPITSYDWKRGLLLKQINYEENGNIMQRLLNTYNDEDDTDNRSEVEGLKCVNEYIGAGDKIPYFAEYKHLSAWNYLTSTQKTVFSNDGSDSITTLTEYFYDNPEHAQLTRTIEQNSDGSEFMSLFEYPMDDPQNIYTSPEVIQSMIDRNMINTLLRKTIKKDGELIDGQIINYDYKQSNTDPILRNSVEKLEGSVYIKKLQIDEYDNKCNLVQFHKEDNYKTSIIYGYDYTQPIAKIENATFNYVESNLGCTIEELQNKTDIQLRTIFNNLRDALPDAMITSYTYKPLVGMKTETDPSGKTIFYDYDNFNRLETIKDQDGKIIKHIDYHYKDE
jgi:hypothetical protein